MKHNPNHPYGSKVRKDQPKDSEQTSFIDEVWKKRISNQLWSLPEFSDDDSIDLINDYDNRDDKFVKFREHKSKKTRREE